MKATKYFISKINKYDANVNTNFYYYYLLILLIANWNTTVQGTGAID